MSEGQKGIDPWLRQRSVWRSLQQMALGKIPLAPLGVELHLGTACNMRCPECISRPTIDSLSFSKERAVELASELVDLGVRSVVISGGGEPLIHPAVDEVLQVLHEGATRVSLVTNGTLLLGHEDNLAKYASRLWVSVDASSAKMHERIRPMAGGGSSFEAVIRGMARLSERMGDRLTYSFLLQTFREGGELVSNVGEIKQAAELARKIGCRTFELNVSFGRDLQVNPLHQAIREELGKQIVGLRKMDGERFRAFVGPLLDEVVEGKVPQFSGRSYSRCLAAELRALVSPAGVFICPVHQTLPIARYGDPVTTSIRDIWGSEEHFRALDQVDSMIHCTGACMSMDLNERLGLGLQAVSRGEDVALEADDDLYI